MNWFEDDDWFLPEVPTWFIIVGLLMIVYLAC